MFQKLRRVFAAAPAAAVSTNEPTKHDQAKLSMSKKLDGGPDWLL